MLVSHTEPSRTVLGLLKGVRCHGTDMLVSERSWFKLVVCVEWREWFGFRSVGDSQMGRAGFSPWGCGAFMCSSGVTAGFNTWRRWTVTAAGERSGRVCRRGGKCLESPGPRQASWTTSFNNSSHLPSAPCPGSSDNTNRTHESTAPWLHMHGLTAIIFTSGD
jgi:hypothetical protein